MDRQANPSIFGRFTAYLERVRLYRLDDTRNSLALSRQTRLCFALLPLGAFLVVVFQLYTSSRDDVLLDSTGVNRLSAMTWDIAYYPMAASTLKTCVRDHCWQHAVPERTLTTTQFPLGDPIGNGSWSVNGDAIVRYSAALDASLIKGLATPVLYMPGLRCEGLEVFVEKKLTQSGFGNLPLFVSLPLPAPGQKAVAVDILMTVRPSASYQGFLKTPLFLGNALNVYRAHHRLEFRSFPRHATVVFLLAISALTLCFFIFLDHQRELLALSVALSLLGMAQAVRVGVVPFLGTEAYVILNTWFLAFLAWYALEHMRLNKRLPYALLLSPLIPLGIRAMASHGGGNLERWAKDGIYDGLMLVPLVLSGLAIAVAPNVWKASPRRARAILASGAAFFLYAANLVSLEIGSVAGVAVDRFFDIITLICASTWITSALSSLGTLEERVAKSREDTRELLVLEQEMHLAKEVQEAFIHAGPQESPAFDVATLYKAARKICGDWLCWRELGHGYSFAVIGDVVGKGVQAGLVVSACDGVLNHALATWGTLLPGGEEAAIRSVVKALVQGVFMGRPQRAMTGLILVVREDGQAWLATIGHLPLVGVKGGETRLIATRNPWFHAGLDADQLVVTSFRMKPGELFIGFTDGVCANSRQLRRLVASWMHWDKVDMPELMQRFDRFEASYDDVSIMMVRPKAA